MVTFKRCFMSQLATSTSPQITDIPVIAYEKQLDRDPRWALSEGSPFFEKKGKLQDALRKITRRLADLGIDYAIVGGLALFQHGHRRFTEDVDLLVTKESLKKIHAELVDMCPPSREANSCAMRNWA